MLTFVAEGEFPLFTRLNAGHPNVTVVDEADEVGVPGADFCVHASAQTLALNFDRLCRSLKRQTEKAGKTNEDIINHSSFPTPKTVLFSWKSWDTLEVYRFQRCYWSVRTLKTKHMKVLLPTIYSCFSLCSLWTSIGICAQIDTEGIVFGLVSFWCSYTESRG